MGASQSTISKAGFVEVKESDKSVYPQGMKTWVVDGEATRDIPLAKTGVAAEKPMTMHEVFSVGVANQKNATAPALRVERGADMKWKTWTWAEYHRDCEKFARATMAAGVEQFGAVSIIGFNAPEWHIACVGTVMSGAKAAGIYTTNGPDSCKYIAEHSQSSVVVVENKKQLDKFLAVRDQMPFLKYLIIWDGEVPEGSSTDACKVVTFNEFLSLSDSVSPGQLAERQKLIRPEHCASLIYTSGTTGNPKAVMLSQDNLVFTARSTLVGIFSDYGQQEESFISFLPLSHIAAQMADVWIPIVGLGTLDVAHHGCTTFARPDALKGSLTLTLKACRPTLFFGVPRVWEKIQEAMIAKGRENPSAAKASIAAWAKSIGLAAEEAERMGGNGTMPWGYTVADALVFRKVREALGFDRLRFMASGAAPITKDTLNYFASLRMPIMELYGMSENTGPGTTTYANRRVLGSVGPAPPGCEIKLAYEPSRDKEGEGEVCMRGRHIFMGYMHETEKTQQAIDPEGWLHSGDVGRIDEYGNLFITGRIKELIITAGGENIAPVPVEEALKANANGISQCIMIGDKRKYCSLLVTLKTVMDVDTNEFSDKLAGDAALVSDAKTVSEAQKCDAWKKHIQDSIDAYNKTAVSNAQRIQKFTILDSDFSIPRNELTPTMKLKRPIIYEHYSAEIAGMYA